jgi:hypothetical protein
MPPRPRGIFRRLTDGIRRVLGGGVTPSPPPTPPPRPPPREPPRVPPSGPSGPDTPPPRGQEAQFRDVWNDEASDRIVGEIHDRTGHSETEIFHDLRDVFYPLVTEEDRDTQLTMWSDFLNAFLNDSPSYTKNDFFADWDIARSSFAWEAWREARGYGKK